MTKRKRVRRLTRGQQLRRLVTDAYRLLTSDLDTLSWRDDVKDWTRAAKPFVKG